MSIIPASRLSVSDLARLGNNISVHSGQSNQRRRKRAFVAAVNRSLAVVGEHVGQLHRPLQTPAARSSAISVA